VRKKMLARIVPVIIFAIDVSPALPRGGTGASFFVPSLPLYHLHLLRYEQYQRLLADLVSYAQEDHNVVVYASPPLEPHVIEQAQIQVDRTANSMSPCSGRIIPWPQVHLRHISRSTSSAPSHFQAI
jgi:hypothetical protein